MSEFIFFNDKTAEKKPCFGVVANLQYKGIKT